MFVRPRLTRLPNEILLCICLLLDLPTVLAMKVISKRLKKNLEQLMREEDFWKKMLENYYSREQFASLPHHQKVDYEKVLHTHLTPMKTLTSNFKKNQYYRSYSICSIFYKNYYKIIRGDTAFDLSEIKPLIIKDDAKHLFTKVCRLGSILPVIQQDNFNIKGVKKILRHFDDKKNKFIVADTNFIGLLTSIIDLRAVQCFDLFIRAYLALIIAYPAITTVTQHTLDDVREMIFNKQDDYFIQRFLSLLITFYLPESPDLFKQIEFAVDTNRAHLVRLAIDPLTCEKKQAFFTAWRKLDIYRSLLNDLYSVEHSRHKLVEALKDAISLLENNPALEINGLIELQKNTQSGFANFIQAFSKEHNIISPEISINNRQLR